MELTIYNNIIHGYLNPQSGQAAVDYSEISHLLNNCPETLTEIERLLNQIFPKNLRVNFDADTPVNITSILSNPNYTSIDVDCFPPEISLPLPAPQTPNQRFYYFVITAEAKRIKLRLLQSVKILKDDICAKQEIINVLKLLARFAKHIREHTQSDPIFDFLLVQIVKLYFEITLLFDVLLSETDYFSFQDFYSLRLNRQVDEDETATYQKALHLHQAQRLYNNFDNAAASNLLAQLYGDLEKNPTDNTLIAVICALENAVFLHAENTAVPAFAEIVDSNFAKSILKDKKQTLNNQLNTLSNAREVLTEIENVTENLPDFTAKIPEVVALLTSSVARQLRLWLVEQKEIYKNNAAQIFFPTTQTPAQSTQTQKITP